jgi:hypothetical protein
MDELVKKVASTGPSAILPSMTCSDVEDVLAPALLSRSVSFRSSPHKYSTSSNNSDKTYVYYAQKGFYINDLSGVSDTVPIISPLVLRIIYLSKESKMDQFRQGRLAAPIMGMLCEDDNIEPTLAYKSGHPYERFHAHWERLWRELLAGEGRYLLD